MGLAEHWAWFEAQALSLWRTLSKFFIFLNLSFFTSKVKRIKASQKVERKRKWHDLRGKFEHNCHCLNHVCRLRLCWWWSKGIWYQNTRNTNLNLRIMLITLKWRLSMCFLIWDRGISTKSNLPKAQPWSWPLTRISAVTPYLVSSLSPSCHPSPLKVHCPFFSALLSDCPGPPWLSSMERHFMARHCCC